MITSSERDFVIVKSIINDDEKDNQNLDEHSEIKRYKIWSKF